MQEQIHAKANFAEEVCNGAVVSNFLRHRNNEKRRAVRRDKLQCKEPYPKPDRTNYQTRRKVFFKKLIRLFVKSRIHHADCKGRQLSRVHTPSIRDMRPNSKSHGNYGKDNARNHEFIFRFELTAKVIYQRKNDIHGDNGRDIPAVPVHTIEIVEHV